MEDIRIVATRIKAIRHELNLTQAQMAEKLGISRSTLAGWETTIRRPTAGELMNFCKTFSVTYDFMCGRSDSHQKIGVYASYEIEWSKLNPLGKKVLYEIYKSFTENEIFKSFGQEKE